MKSSDSQEKLDAEFKRKMNALKERKAKLEAKLRENFKFKKTY